MAKTIFNNPNFPKCIARFRNIVPFSIQSDLDKTFSFLVLTFALFLMEAIIILFLVFNKFTSTSTPYLAVSWAVFLPILFIFLYYTERTNLVSHTLILVLFANSIYRCYRCGLFAALIGNNFMICPLAVFLMPSLGQTLIYLFFVLAFEFYMFFATPFPMGVESCFDVQELYKHRMITGVVFLVLSTMVGISLSKICLLKQRILEVETKRAKEATKLYVEFTRTVSHEIRTPLFTVVGLAELLSEDTKIDPSIRQILNDILSSSEELNKLLTTVLDFSNPAGAFKSPRMKTCNEKVQ
eukprot:TRINITY_DN174_c1_g1_i1.p1 TRINITY_DN174_c1_g1~~TRINITY_DN174_c1_g1_i1.p1  ORF type:complete len:297 (-),score=39.57 TRINITY_DN174_c1_g1_i1:45-935(-)